MYFNTNYLRNIALVFFCAKPRNLLCELLIRINAMINKTKSVFAQYCTLFYYAILLRIVSTTCATWTKNDCVIFNATNIKEKCHCVKTLFQNMNSVILNIKYWFIPSGFNDIGLEKLSLWKRPFLVSLTIFFTNSFISNWRTKRKLFIYNFLILNINPRCESACDEYYFICSHYI